MPLPFSSHTQAPTPYHLDSAGSPWAIISIASRSEVARLAAVAICCNSCRRRVASAATWSAIFRSVTSCTVPPVRIGVPVASRSR